MDSSAKSALKFPGTSTALAPRIVGVAPAAGHAARLGAIGQSKEMLEIGGRPVWEHLLERMLLAAPDEVRVVARPEKTDLVTAARAMDARVILARPPTVARSIAAGVADLTADDLVMLGFPDTVWDPRDGFVQLVAILAHGPVDVVLGLFRTPDLNRSDVVVCDAGGLVRSVAVKPDVPESDLIWGCAAARVGALEGLSEVEAPGYLFDRLARTGSVRGLFLSDSWIDIGTPEGLRAARGRGTKDVGTADTVRRRGRT